MTTENPKVWAYIRCSTLEQAEANSLETQRLRIAAWAEATGSEITEWIIDAGVSGTKPLSSRPGGSRIAALLDSKRPGVEAVVVAKLDRLGRDAAESLQLFKRFRVGTVGLVSVADRIDLSTPQGRAFAAMASVFSQLERELIAQRTAENLMTIRREGRVYGVVPYGYRAEAGRLVSDDDEQTVLTHIRKLRKANISYSKISQRLNEQGTPAKRGGVWYAMSVRNSLAASQKMLAVKAA